MNKLLCKIFGHSQIFLAGSPDVPRRSVMRELIGIEMVYKNVYGQNWTEDYADENGKYLNDCRECGYTFMGHKYRRICKCCASL